MLKKQAKLQIVILAISMSFIVGLSNYLVQFPINDYITIAAFSYPICFLITDLTNKILGARSAKLVVLVGFLIGIILSIGIDLRIAIASLSAFLIAQLIDIKIFSLIRSRAVWQAPLISSLISSLIDTIIFFGLAFYATGLNWAQLALGDYSVKVVIILLSLIPYISIIKIIKTNKALQN